jgi:hypothetical protein
MKTINVSEATKVQLDWLMTSIETPDELRYGVQDWREQRCNTKNGEFMHRWTQNWAMTGPLLESAELKLHCGVGGVWWAAHNSTPHHPVSGDGALVAVCRCYITYCIGSEVEIPEELA